MKFTPEVQAALQTLKDAAENDFERHRIDVLEKDLTAPPKVEIIDDKHQKFNGIVYHKDKSGYHVSHHYLLHRAVYVYYFGDTPKNYVIHHVDWDKNHNDISNLVCLSRHEHTSIHVNQGKEEYGLKYMRCKCCNKIFLPSNFQRKEFCSDKCRRDFFHEKEKVFSKKCLHCGKTYKTRTESSKFCSLQCSNLYISSKRREIKKCPVCGKIFSAKKSSQQKFCSRICANKRRSKKNQSPIKTLSEP